MRYLKCFIISLIAIYVVLGVRFSSSARIEWVLSATFWDKLHEHARLMFFGNVLYNLLISLIFASAICIVYSLFRFMKTRRTNGKLEKKDSRG